MPCTCSPGGAGAGGRPCSPTEVSARCDAHVRCPCQVARERRRPTVSPVTGNLDVFTGTVQWDGLDPKLYSSVQSSVCKAPSVQLTEWANPLMCNYPNVHVSGWASSRMCFFPCAFFRCAFPQCAYLRSPSFRFLSDIFRPSEVICKSLSQLLI